MKAVFIVIIAVAIIAVVAIVANQYVGERPVPDTQEEVSQEPVVNETDVAPFGELSEIPELSIPASVVEKYQELDGKYKQFLGAMLSRCTKDNELIYYVSGSGGFSGVSFYYDGAGEEFGKYLWGDAIAPGRTLPKPPIDILEYECTILEKSERDI